MSVKITVDYYSDICDSFSYGRKILEYPHEIVEAIDDYFDGMDIEFRGPLNPDNVYTNILYVSSAREILVSKLRLLTYEAFSELVESGRVEEYIEVHFEEIKSRLNDLEYFLGYVGGYFYIMR